MSILIKGVATAKDGTEYMLDAESIDGAIDQMLKIEKAEYAKSKSVISEDI